jgi:hypothetical protein
MRATHDSMHLYLLFPTVNTAAHYLVYIKSYTENTIRGHFVVGSEIIYLKLIKIYSAKRNIFKQCKTQDIH